MTNLSEKYLSFVNVDANVCFLSCTYMDIITHEEKKFFLYAKLPTLMYLLQKSTSVIKLDYKYVLLMLCAIFLFFALFPSDSSYHMSRRGWH